MKESKFWPYIEAKKIIENLSNKDEPIILQTGFGASGLPHIGTFGEAAKTYFIMLALKDFGYDSKLIVFSDDMDGLRKVPLDFPPEFKKYLQMPVSSIPDPFGCCPSMTIHINQLARELINKMGIPYEFKSSTEEYKKGTFDAEIKEIILNDQLVREINVPTMGEETGEKWYPFFPICQNCHRLNTSRVLEVDKENFLVSYICDQELPQVKGCGYKGEVSVFRGNGKLPWKVDWAARWHAFKVNYELYGKDLVDSAKVSKQILSRIFRQRPPAGLFYELFLAEDGSKISKSKGQGLTVNQWLTYGSMDSLLLLMLKKPQQAKRLSEKTILLLENEVKQLTDEFYEKIAHISETERKGDRGEYEFIKFFKVPSQKPLVVDMETLLNLIGAIGFDDSHLIFTYLKKAKFIPEQSHFEDLRPSIERAIRYYRDFILPDRKKPEPLKPAEKVLFQKLIDFLKEERTADEIHNQVYSLAREQGYEPKDFFRLIYQHLLGQERGPRLGGFFTLIGQDKAKELLLKAVMQN